MPEKAIIEKQMDSVLEKYGFTRHSFSSDHSMYAYMNFDLGITVKIYPVTNEFEIIYMLDNSILFLSSPVCSPFYEETPKYEQFKKIFTQFMKAYNKLI